MKGTGESFELDGGGGGCPEDRYSAMRERALGGGVREDGELLADFGKEMGELEMQSRWYAGEFGERFTSTGGREVEVCDFGHWNHAAGPDFVDCAVMVDGELRRGAIELDPDVRDWERHGHGRNANYDAVVLHLFVRAPEAAVVYTRTSAHLEVPQVRLDLSKLEEFSVGRYAEARLGRCAAPLRDMSEGKVDSLLAAAARFRMKRKGERMVGTAKIHGREQALFQGVAEALGYARNRRPMLVLSQRFPLRMLKSAEGEAEALLFGAAGFLDPEIYERGGSGGKDYLRRLWEGWWKRRGEMAGEALKWDFSGIRPGNHPHRRLGALMAIVRNWKMFATLTASAKGFEARGVADFFESLEHPFWDVHYTLTSGPAERAIALVGAARAGDILANQVYPLLMREDATLWKEYAKLPAKMESGSVRRAAARLLGKHPDRPGLTRRVFQQQGLLQIYADYCLADASGCRECPFPEQLGEWGEGV